MKCLFLSSLQRYLTTPNGRKPAMAFLFCSLLCSWWRDLLSFHFGKRLLYIHVWGYENTGWSMHSSCFNKQCNIIAVYNYSVWNVAVVFVSGSSTARGSTRLTTTLFSSGITSLMLYLSSYWRCTYSGPTWSSAWWRNFSLEVWVVIIQFLNSLCIKQKISLIWAKNKYAQFLPLYQM